MDLKFILLEAGKIDIEEVLQDAADNNIYFDFEWLDEDDWWTDRKGGYEVTYELGDDSSWHSEPEPTPHSHKCTKCKWTGASYDAEWQWSDKDGNEYDEAKHVCPMCESALELTPDGVIAENEQKKRLAEIEEMFAEDDEE